MTTRGIHAISTADIARLPRPPNATTFFIGDEAGGSGWQVEIAPGIIEKYYVDLPGDFEVKTGLTFRDAPADTANERDAIELCAHYLQRMEQIVAEAEKRWSPPKS